MSPRVTRSMKRLQNEKKKVTKKVTKKKKSKKNIQVESDDFLVEEGSISSRLSVEYEEDKPEESLSSASNCHPTFKRRLSHGPGSQSDIGESNAEDLSAIEEVDEDVDVDDHDDLDDGAEDVDDHDDLDDGATVEGGSLFSRQTGRLFSLPFVKEQGSDDAVALPVQGKPRLFL